METHEQILNYLTNSSPESKTRLTNYYSDQLKEIAILLSKMTEILDNYNLSHPNYDGNNPKHVANGLMIKSKNTLMAAIESVLNGYYWEPPILMRNCLEGFSVAWDIIHHVDRFSLYKDDKSFKSTYSISNLKKEIESLGKLYGHLSNMNVHVSAINSSPSCLNIDGVTKVQYFGFVEEGKEHTRSGEIYLSILCSFICLQIAEISYHEYSDELETIEKISGTNLVKNIVSDRHRKFVEEMEVVFEKMKETPNEFI